MDKEESAIQTRYIIGTGLIILGIIIVMLAMRTPKVTTTSETVSVSISETAKSTKAKNAESESSTELPDYPLDINTATAEEFMTIDGLGEHKAKLIVAYREQYGEYSSIYDLTNIKGITAEYIKNIEAYLTV
ncbi:MAG: helix-hairpin-helix domain-containing protein [Eubacterium sp.]|nr:helix-hairpin-helix domain-containing protein [Eubacterium sp.]